MLKHFTKYMHWVLSLRFLFDKFNTWLFDGTRAIEILSGLSMLGFSFTFIVAGDELYKEDLYEKFQHLHTPTLISILLIVAVLQLLFSIFKSTRLKLISSFLLMLSGLIWAIITGTFIAGYPPFSTGMTTYAVLTIICSFAGLYLNRQTKRIEDTKQGL